MIEIWKPIPEYYGLYEVSSLGRVKSLNYHRSGKSKILHPVPTNKGYLTVTLYNNGRRQVKIHRLVALVFLPNPNNLPQINHKDENKTNNCVDNLEWCDNKHNCNYGTHNTRMSNSLKGKYINGHLAKQVCQYDLDGNLIKIWPSTMEIQRQLGFRNGSISKCCLGDLKTAYGFIWSYYQN